MTEGQAILHRQIAQLSSEVDMTQTELDKVHDTFARLPHYIAKLTAMRNTIASVTVLSRKLKRRADQVAIGREKQAAKMQVARAKEQAYDQAVAAVQASTSSDTVQPPGQSSGSVSPSSTNSQHRERSRTPTRMRSPSLMETNTIRGGRSSPSSRDQQSTSMPPIRLPFPLPAKPAFPIVSTTRLSSGSGSSSPSLLPQRTSPLLSERISERDLSKSPIPAIAGTGTPKAIGTDTMESIALSPERIDRFPQVSSMSQDDTGVTTVSVSSEVEVVRLRRKKKAISKSSTSSLASISTNTSIKKGFKKQAGIGTSTSTSTSTHTGTGTDQ
ncbi:hypothetical protein BGZ51_000134 [Haplosporangium sp. Z 767]|nr:hypothetical protein BGZ50_009159 [Haplosporangium sp. Z 11]KAF9194382.1 hypothetical protein BGZ51_000134 [Haplosporangium sp. Z 767]